MSKKSYKKGDTISFKVIEVSQPYFGIMKVQGENGEIYVMDASGKGPMAWIDKSIEERMSTVSSYAEL